MDLNWQPATPEPDHEAGATTTPAPASAMTATPPPSPAAPPDVAATTPTTKTTGIRRLLATAALTVGLLAVGGVSVVMAASPAPSTTTAPSVQPHNGGTPGAIGTHNCPNMGTNGSPSTSG